MTTRNISSFYSSLHSDLRCHHVNAHLELEDLSVLMRLNKVHMRWFVRSFLKRCSMAQLSVI